MANARADRRSRIRAAHAAVCVHARGPQPHPPRLSDGLHDVLQLRRRRAGSADAAIRHWRKVGPAPAPSAGGDDAHPAAGRAVLRPHSDPLLRQTPLSMGPLSRRRLHRQRASPGPDLEGTGTHRELQASHAQPVRHDLRVLRHLRSSFHADVPAQQVVAPARCRSPSWHRAKLRSLAHTLRKPQRPRHSHLRPHAHDGRNRSMSLGIRPSGDCNSSSPRATECSRSASSPSSCSRATSQ